jgi:ethanolamine ammonia-lyase small subunit
MDKQKMIISPDPWQQMRAFTRARIALGSTGVSQPMQQNLLFKAAHAAARDAVFGVLDKEMIRLRLADLSLPSFLLTTRAESREQYLKRPDLGRLLSDPSTELLKKNRPAGRPHLCITIADGLSAAAVNRYAPELLMHLIPMLEKQKYLCSPVCIIEQARVAAGDITTMLSEAVISLILIGERPGLSSPESMGAYITYEPGTDTIDAMRNCVSNIHQDGLSCTSAAATIFYLLQESYRRKLSGVLLKDLSEVEKSPVISFNK